MSSELILVKYCPAGFVTAVMETVAAGSQAEALEGVVTLLGAGTFGVLFRSDTPVITVLKRGIELAQLVALAGGAVTKH